MSPRSRRPGYPSTGTGCRSEVGALVSSSSSWNRGTRSAGVGESYATVPRVGRGRVPPPGKIPNRNAKIIPYQYVEYTTLRWKDPGFPRKRPIRHAKKVL